MLDDRVSAPWNANKTEAIDPATDFWWLDDNPSQEDPDWLAGYPRAILGGLMGGNAVRGAMMGRGSDFPCVGGLQNRACADRESICASLMPIGRRMTDADNTGNGAVAGSGPGPPCPHAPGCQMLCLNPIRSHKVCRRSPAAAPGQRAVSNDLGVYHYSSRPHPLRQHLADKGM